MPSEHSILSILHTHTATSLHPLTIVKSHTSPVRPAHTLQLTQFLTSRTQRAGAGSITFIELFPGRPELTTFSPTGTPAYETISRYFLM